MGLTQQAFQLRDVEPMVTDHGAIQQQDGHVETVATLQDRVAIDIHDINGWQLHRPAERLELFQHFIAQIAFLAMDNRKTRVNGAGRPERSWR